MIRIQKTDDSFDMVKPQLLDEYIQTGTVHAFRRASGWAVIGRDPIRKQGRAGTYTGPERRRC